MTKNILDKRQYATELFNMIQLINQQSETLRNKPETEDYVNELKNEFKNFTGMRYSNNALKKLNQPTKEKRKWRI